jgi:predicted nucleic acid-binding protein
LFDRLILYVIFELLGGNKVLIINYLDASAIVKLLIEEAQSKILKEYFSRNSNFYTTSFCFIEALGVLKRKKK